MITLREIGSLILALIILAFANSFIDFNKFLYSLVFFAIILTVYVAAKKFAAWYVECKEEIKILTFQRYGVYERSFLKTPIPMGLILPFALTILSLGWVKWFAVLESTVEGTTARAARRHDIYSYSELTEWHLAVVSGAGIFSMFLVAIFSYLLNFPELSRLSIYFAAFNMLPLGKLDGVRVFFGSRPMFTILWILNILGLVYAFLL